VGVDIARRAAEGGVVFGDDPIDIPFPLQVAFLIDVDEDLVSVFLLRTRGVAHDCREEDYKDSPNPER